MRANVKSARKHRDEGMSIVEMEKLLQLDQPLMITLRKGKFCMCTSQV